MPDTGQITMMSSKEKDAPAPHLLTRKQAAEFLAERGVHATSKTLDRWAHLGGGPAYRVFRHRALYDPATLEIWIDHGPHGETPLPKEERPAAPTTKAPTPAPTPAPAHADGPKRYLSRVEAAEYLKACGLPCSPKTLANYASNGDGPPYRARARRALYLPEELDAWLLALPEQKNSK